MMNRYSKKIRSAIDRDMRSKRLNIIVHVFGFLILSVGILYLCQFMSTKINEGFQMADSGITCPQIKLSDNRNIYMCDNQSEADFIMSDIPKNLINSNDNVCVSTITFGSNYYTCYDRPPGLVYDSNYGVFQPADSFFDRTASDIAPGIDVACAALTTNTTQVIMKIKSTVLIRNTLQNIITSTVIFANNLAEVSTLKCDINKVEPNLSNVCSGDPNKINTFSNTITYFSTLQDYKINDDSYSLNDILGVVQTSLNTLVHLSANVLSPSYNGMKCDTNINGTYILKVGF